MLKDTLIEFIGEYTPVIADSGEVLPDWSWILSCVFLIVLIYSLFRLGGALLCRR